MISDMKHYCRRFSAIVILLAVIGFSGSVNIAHAAYLQNVPVTVYQPGGDELNIFASGNEYNNWLHDKNATIIVQNSDTGYYVYAIKKNDVLYISDHVVNSIDPATLKPNDYAKSKRNYATPVNSYRTGSPLNVNKIKQAPKTGAINNIVIFIRFSDETEFTESISSYDSMFNSTASGYNSMKNYFVEASYNQLTISTSFYPLTTSTVLSYQDTQPRSYYQPYNASTNPTGYSGDSQRTTREHILLKKAVDAISSQVPADIIIDGDNDGFVDNVCFIVKGGPTGWSSLLWPHMWSLYSQDAFINGKQVQTFNFQLQTSLASSGVGVLCHEMFHSLGSPDLYHYTNNGINPVYKWGLMGYDSNPPRHMLSYMKHRYGLWINSIPEITSTGTYTLNPLVSPLNNCFKIASPNSTTEYFVLEYRRATGPFESSLLGSGLLVYRINTGKDGQGNADGPPDEVYIYRPDGTVSVNGSPDSAYFSSETGRTFINDTSNPSCFLSNGNDGGISISDIGSAGETLSFRVDLGDYKPVEVRYSWTMDENPEWTTEGAWAWGQPTGSDGDPAGGSTGNMVYGYNLSGSYDLNMSEQNLTTKAINCKNLSTTQLRFKRWLGVEESSYDHAYLKVSTNGEKWTTIWQNTENLIENSWSNQIYDISAIADGQSTLYIRWTMGTTDDSVQYCGWNIDDVELWGVSEVTLADAIESLKIVAGLNASETVNINDVNGDNKIGIAETLYILRQIAESY